MLAYSGLQDGHIPVSQLSKGGVKFLECISTLNFRYFRQLVFWQETLQDVLGEMSS